MIRFRYDVNGQDQAEIRIVNTGQMELGLYKYKVTDIRGKATQERKDRGWQLLSSVLKALYGIEPKELMLTRSKEA